jgi:GrxC family glutaredoxin
MNQITEFVMNNWVLFAALIVILIMLARTWLGPGGVKSVRPMEAVTLSNHKDAVFVDVRTDQEYREGHVLYALHTPLGLINTKLKDLAKYKNRPLVVYCRTGNRSGQAGAILKKQGFGEVYNLTGGILAWQSANLPLTKVEQPPPTNNTPAVAAISDLDNESSEGVNTGSSGAEMENGPGGVPAKGGQAETNAQAGGDNAKRQTTEVVVYTTQRCPFCVRAVDLLNKKGIGYKEINIDNQPELREEMERKAQRKTVPQIFIGDFHVGGCDDMYELEDNGRLDSLLDLK